MSEQELLQRWRSGDADAGEALIRAHYRAIYQFFFGKVGAQACADLTQSTFETLCTKRDDFAGDSSLRTYLFGIARHKLANYVRAEWARRGREDEMDRSLPDPAVDRSWASLFEDRHRESLVVRALRQLSLDDQILLELKDYEGLTARHLAEIFDVPPGTIAGRIQRARGRLKEAIRELAATQQDVDDTLTSLDECMREIRARVSSSIAGAVGTSMGLDR